jgi:hypothetical protein
MKLKSFKTIQVLYVVVCASAFLTACNTKVTEPLKSMSGQGVAINQALVLLDNAVTSENYGVPQAQSVLFSKNADDASLDFTY